MIIGNKWDIYFLSEAWLISTRSKDPSTQCGSVIVAPNKSIVSKGYNGLPATMPDTHEHYHNRPLKYETIIHAEINAQIFATRQLNGCCLYTWPLLPCSRCASQMIQAGIERVVAPINTIERWEENIKLSKQSLMTSGVTIVEYDKEEVLENIKTLMERLLCLN